MKSSIDLQGADCWLARRCEGEDVFCKPVRIDDEVLQPSDRQVFGELLTVANQHRALKVELARQVQSMVELIHGRTAERASYHERVGMQSSAVKKVDALAVRDVRAFDDGAVCDIDRDVSGLGSDLAVILDADLAVKLCLTTEYTSGAVSARLDDPTSIDEARQGRRRTRVEAGGAFAKLEDGIFLDDDGCTLARRDIALLDQ